MTDDIALVALLDALDESVSLWRTGQPAGAMHEHFGYAAAAVASPRHRRDACVQRRLQDLAQRAEVAFLGRRVTRGNGVEALLGVLHSRETQVRLAAVLRDVLGAGSVLLQRRPGGNVYDVWWRLPTAGQLALLADDAALLVRQAIDCAGDRREIGTTVFLDITRLLVPNVV